MKPFALLIISLALTFGFAFGQRQGLVNYEDQGRRDPFIPLVDEQGRYLLDTEVLYSSDEVKLSGILWDPQGESSVLINNQIVKIGESVNGFTLERITKDSITISKHGKEYTIRLSIKGKE